MFRMAWCVFLVAATPPAPAAEGDHKALAARLASLGEKDVAARDEQARRFPQMLARDARAQRDAANRRESEAWRAVKDRAGWERFRDARLKALRESLGTFPEPPRALPVRVTATLRGDGYRIENLVFESRPGLWVTANLYLPEKPARPMPGILLCHSHHNPKAQGELQDMGTTWARLGCAVLVMDQLGHGERRQHPFVDEKAFAGRFRPGRQDYYFRYNVALQLHLAGESLIGWMAWDLMRGVDLLLARPGIDKEKIVLMGAVAGGGDPAAVTAALDRRIAAAVPFNFGGPQPETTYPLPADADAAFNYAGGGSWESTRNLRLSARDGFLPWVIVGGLAPRRLVYAHEFAWDRDRDPVWARLQKIYGFYNVPDHLAFAHGRGKLSGQPPESTHCNNIGAEHRKHIYLALKRWFDIDPPEKEQQARRSAAELTCLTPALARAIKPQPAWGLARSLGEERAEAFRKRLSGLDPAARRKELREAWGRLLDEARSEGKANVLSRDERKVGDVTLERVLLEVEPGVDVPMLLVLPPRKADERLAVVVGVAQEGKSAFLKGRAEELAGLLGGGVAVCLPDVRGTGETQPGGGRGRTSAATSISATELMVGHPLLGLRLRDLRSVLGYLRGRKELDAKKIVLWGDSFAPVNGPGAAVEVPLDAEKMPHQAEPLGGLLALFGALFEEDVRAASVRGGLVSYESLLRGPYLWVPHDAVVPGALTAGDLADVAAALAPRSLRLEGLVDGLNRAVSAGAMKQAFKSAREAYRSAEESFSIEGEDLVRWVLRPR